jgi:drug/metabolite transporter (DMT)-like permease
VLCRINWGGHEGENVNLGFLYMVISLTCFGLIGILVKFPDTRGCKASAVYALAYAWSIPFGVCFVILFRGAEFHVQSAVYAIALPFGMMSAVGGIVFIAGVRYGKISTSWLIINLSAAIPAVGSVVLYHEPVNAKTIAVLVLAVLAVLLLWKDKQVDEARRTAAAIEQKEQA